MENKKTVNIGHFLNRLDDSRLKNKILCTPRIWELLISVSKMSEFFMFQKASEYEQNACYKLSKNYEPS